jgi:hypothetical protein
VTKLYLQSGTLLSTNLMQICVHVLWVTLLVSLVLGADLVAVTLHSKISFIVHWY